MPYENQDWYKDHDGNRHSIISERQQEFIQYLLDPRPKTEKGTQTDFCKRHGITTSAVSQWKRIPLFKEALNQAAMELNGGIERTQIVVNALFEKAAGGDTKAAQLYLQYVGQFMPTQKIITDDRSIQEMSLEELEGQLAEVVKLRKEA